MELSQCHQTIINLIESWKIQELCEQYFAAEFIWEVKGSSQLSKTYTSKQDYYKQALYRLQKHLQPKASIKLIHSYSCGNTLIVELEGNMTTLSGQQYNNQYCWVIKTQDNLITSITAYLDTLLLEKILSDEKNQ
ncbi:nuclear transport factor 2 family protein [Piscirickettsia litoralis]|uniref:SnoaL-like domain-containing protein n=1 Tax=Piscirickettsia litoralis TaxID=1891921 RepID=A0ABX3A278_9GAMM|nr:hypothetical protein [Piscirickettsia litoralis]ODN41738.1 hypothetical protein BGC07_00480 [Piscirickettsia litoralis]